MPHRQNIANDPAIEQALNLGFSLSEVNNLGVYALNEFDSMYGMSIINFTFRDLRRLYSDLIADPARFKPFAEYLAPRFALFIGLCRPMRIYVGGDKQFIQRGDEQLEKALANTCSVIRTYADTGYITPKRISIVLYYLNLMH